MDFFGKIKGKKGSKNDTLIKKLRAEKVEQNAPKSKDDLSLKNKKWIETIEDKILQANNIARRQKAIRKQLLSQGKFYTEYDKRKAECTYQLRLAESYIAECKAEINNLIDIDDISYADLPLDVKNRANVLQGMIQKTETRMRNIKAEWKNYRKIYKHEKNSDVLNEKTRLHSKAENNKFENYTEIELETKNPHKYDCLGWALSDIWGKKGFMQFTDGNVKPGIYNPAACLKNLQQNESINEQNAFMCGSMCKELQKVKLLEAKIIKYEEIQTYKKKVEAKGAHGVIVAMRLAGEWKPVAGNGYVWSQGYHFMKYSQDSKGKSSWTHKWGGDGKYRLLDNLDPEQDKAWISNTAHNGLKPLDTRKSQTSYGTAKTIMLSWDNWDFSNEYYKNKKAEFVSSVSISSDLDRIVLKIDDFYQMFNVRNNNFGYTRSYGQPMMRILGGKFEQASPEVKLNIEGGNIIMTLEGKTYPLIMAPRINKALRQTSVGSFIFTIEPDFAQLILSPDEEKLMNIKKEYEIHVKCNPDSVVVSLHAQPPGVNNWMQDANGLNLFNYAIVRDESEKKNIVGLLENKKNTLHQECFFSVPHAIYGAEVGNSGYLIQAVYDTSKLEEKEQIKITHVPYISKTEYIYVDASKLYAKEEFIHKGAQKYLDDTDMGIKK